MPMLRGLSTEQRPIVLIARPHRPYAPGLRQQGVALSKLTVGDTANDHDALWASEELLRARAGAVLLWHDTIDTIAQRRLQLAAETGDGIALVYRRLTRRDTASVAAQIGRAHV